jgi:hypothetical protein
MLSGGQSTLKLFFKVSIKKADTMIFLNFLKKPLLDIILI